LITDVGVPLSTKNNYGVSAIIFAANNGHFKLVEELVNIRADIEDRSNNGRTPLLWASVWGHFDVCAFLVNQGANMSVSDIEGMSPIMWATKNGHVRVLKFLIKRGAPVTRMNKYNGTALSIARIKGRQDLIDILEPLFPTEVDPSPFVIMFEIIVNGTCDYAEYALGELSTQYAMMVQTVTEWETYKHAHKCIHPYIQIATDAVQPWWRYMITNICNSLPILSSSSWHPLLEEGYQHLLQNKSHVSNGGTGTGTGTQDTFKRYLYENMPSPSIVISDCKRYFNEGYQETSKHGMLVWSESVKAFHVVYLFVSYWTSIVISDCKKYFNEGYQETSKHGILMWSESVKAFRVVYPKFVSYWTTSVTMPIYDAMGYCWDVITTKRKDEL
jgi:hypothetical protein